MDKLILLLTVIITLYGLLVGSFLNAWVWRLHTGRKVSQGRSICPKCHKQLKWYELIPVFSFIGLKGKCRSCHKPISWQYPFVELATGLLWAGLFYYIQPDTIRQSGEFLVWIVIGSLLIAAFVYDLKWMELPDQFTLSAIAFAIAWLVVRWLYFGEVDTIQSQLIAAILFGGFYYLLWFGSGGKWLGDGDIRLAVLMALVLTTQQLVISIFIAYFIGAIVGASLIAARQKTRKDTIAFGPFLIIGLILGYLWGNSLVDLYFKLLT